MKKLLLAFALLFLIVLPVFSLEKMDFKYGFISDNANLITQEDYTYISNIIKELQEKTTADIAVVTVNSLEGKSIEDTAVEIGRKYKVGAKHKNNGVVILVAPNERKARIEVGMGLESDITNSKADTIMNADMVPYFSKGEYSKGIHKGVASTATLIAESYGTTLINTANAPAKTTSENKKKNSFPLWAWPLMLLAIPFGRGKGGRFGGGGGFSGGKGSTGSW